MKQIAKAFLEAQKEMGNATKGSKNPFFKSKYADLNSVREACIPALNAHGIAVLQPIVQIEGRNFVQTLFLHESGETIESFTEILFSKQNDAQAQGSGISYARRYGLQSLANIGAEDDDGQSAVKTPKSKSTQSTPVKSAEKGKLTDERFKKALEALGKPETKEATLTMLRTFSLTPEQIKQVKAVK
jgi:hypothetical protein